MYIAVCSIAAGVLSGALYHVVFRPSGELGWGIAAMASIAVVFGLIGGFMQAEG